MNKLKNILIIVLFGIILFQSFFRTSPKPEYITRTDTVTTIHDSIRYVPKPFPVYHDTGSFHAVPIYIRIKTDTAAIVADYIRKIAYSDTLLNDSTAFVLVQDTLQYNRIVSRTKKIKIYTYTKTLTIPHRSHFYGGFGIGGNRNQFGFTGNIGFQAKRGNLYTANYDILNRTIFVSIYFRIR